MQAPPGPIDTLTHSLALIGSATRAARAARAAGAARRLASLRDQLMLGLPGQLAALRSQQVPSAVSARQHAGVSAEGTPRNHLDCGCLGSTQISAARSPAPPGFAWRALPQPKHRAGVQGRRPLEQPGPAATPLSTDSILVDARACSQLKVGLGLRLQLGS